MNKYIDYVRSQLSDRTILEQLAEEAAELSQASLKLIRACNLSGNTTPVSEEEATNNLIEEFIDVCMNLYLIGAISGSKDILENPKWERWARRLGYEYDK